MNQTPSLNVSFYQFLLVTMTTVIREGNIAQVTLRGYIQNEHHKLLLSLRSDIQDAYCKSMLSLQKSYLKCVLRIYAVIARILFKMRIAILCCHCKNFIQNAYSKVMLSLQEFYSKWILQNCSVTARILCKTRIANLCCHCIDHTLQSFFGVFVQNNATSFEQRAVGSATMIFPAQLHHLLISQKADKRTEL